MNVVYVDVDSLRADHVGAYGYPEPTTPAIDAFAEDAVRFERAYVADSPCMPSRAGVLSGRYGVHSGVVTHGQSAQQLRSPKTERDWFAGWAEDWTGDTRNALAEWTGSSREWLTLPELFFHDRVRTCAVSSFPRHTAPWFYHLWHEFRQPQEPEGDSEYFQTPRAADVIDEAIDLLDRRSPGEDVFLYAQLWDPHTPYHRSPEERARFADLSLPPHPTDAEIREHREWAPSSARQIGIEDRSDLRELLANYDAEIRYADHHVGRLLSALRERGIYDETLVVVTADHGEEFGEHGIYRQHATVHEGTQRVPLLIKPPASTAFDPGARDHLVTNVDLPATIADYAEYDAPGQWQGRSLRPAVEGSTDADADEWRDGVVLTHGLYTAQRAIRTDRWKYVRTYHPGMFDEGIPAEGLYEVDADPWESENVADERPGLREDLRARMTAWVDETQGRYDDPLRSVARAGPPGYQAGEAYWGRDISGDAGRGDG